MAGGLKDLSVRQLIAAAWFFAWMGVLAWGSEPWRAAALGALLIVLYWRGFCL